MKHRFPYPPLGSQALDAIDQIERASSLKGLDNAFETVRSEAFRHWGPSLLICLVIIIPITVLVAGARVLGWIDSGDTWIFAFAPALGVALTPAAEYLLRGPRRAEDEKRVRDALNVWKVLHRAEKEA